MCTHIYYVSGADSGGDSGNETDAKDSLKHPLRFLSHSSNTLNNWFDNSPLCSTILYGIVFIVLFLYIFGERKGVAWQLIEIQ